MLASIVLINHWTKLFEPKAFSLRFGKQPYRERGSSMKQAFAVYICEIGAIEEGR